MSPGNWGIFALDSTGVGIRTALALLALQGFSAVVVGTLIRATAHGAGIP